MGHQFVYFRFKTFNFKIICNASSSPVLGKVNSKSTLREPVYKWLMVGRRVSLSTSASFINKTDLSDTEILYRAGSKNNSNLRFYLQYNIFWLKINNGDTLFFIFCNVRCV
jgi:hypothetical protein